MLIESEEKVIVFGTGIRVIAPIFLYKAKSWIWIVPGMIINALAGLCARA